MLWPIVVALIALWVLGLILEIPGTYTLLVIAAILALFNVLISWKRARPAGRH